MALLIETIGCNGRPRREGEDDRPADTEDDAPPPEREGPDIDDDGTIDYACPEGSTGWTGESCGYPRGPSTRGGLAYLNWWRSLVGLDPVGEDGDLSRGCRRHLAYLQQNGIFDHYEDPSLPGYTDEGAEAGPASELALAAGWEASSYTFQEAMDGWISTLYHRLRSFDPNLRDVGLAFSKEGDSQSTTAMACLNDSMGIGAGGTMVSPVPYPAPGMTEVVPYFGGFEWPCPTRTVSYMGEDACAASGTIVTLQFWRNEQLVVRSGELIDDKGDSVPGMLHHTGNPDAPNPEFLDGLVAFVPEEPLEPGITYTVSISATVDDHATRFEWTFTTAQVAIPALPL